MFTEKRDRKRGKQRDKEEEGELKKSEEGETPANSFAVTFAAASFQRLYHINS